MKASSKNMADTGRAPEDEVTDHGGNLARARRQFPHAPEPWLDLSTGINPHPYPFEAPAASAFTRLPDESRMNLLLKTAASAYGVPSPDLILAAPGTQILLPQAASLVARGRAAVLSPTYGEHQRAAALAGHHLALPSRLAELAGADYGVVVNPNNPDGRMYSRAELIALARMLGSRGGRLLVDEAFMDAGDRKESLAPDVGDHGALVLRSFGKFFGLAGVRLGFAIGPAGMIARLRSRLGPWAVSGPAIEIGIAVLSDVDWQISMRRQLAAETAELDAVLMAAGLTIAGGTSLFRFVRTADAQALHRRLGEAGILVRSFAWDDHALRIGLPGDPAGLARLREALAGSRPQ